MTVHTHKLAHTDKLCACPTQGLWRAAMYNPMRAYQMAFNLTVSKHATCLNNCSSHGKCSEDGVCVCTGNWQGGDCSVSPSAACQPGSRAPLRM